MAVNLENPPKNLDLRDYFAAHALIALYSCAGFVKGLDSAAEKKGVPFKVAMAQHAYGMADEMLVERERANEPS